MSDQRERAVAIVGMGCRLPGSPDVTALWRTLSSAAVPVREVPRARWDHDSFYDPNPRRADRSYARMLASVDDIDQFSPEFFGVLPRRARFMDPQQRLLLDAARAAIEDAGVTPPQIAGHKTGVYVGISISEYYQLTCARLLATQMKDGRLGRFAPDMEAAWEFLTESVPPLQAHTMVGQMLNMAAANVAQAFDLRGPAFAIDSACSSAMVAMAEAIVHLRAGIIDTALVGGVYVACTPNNMVAFSRIGAISPSEICRPFDERADGFVLGEGAGCLLLKRLEDAIAAEDRIWAVVRGFGMTNDGRSEGPMTPRLDGQIAALELAYADAGVSPAEVGLIEAHGTATRVGDLTESRAVAQVFGGARRGGAGVPCVVTSIKGNIGHTLAAAGAAGVMSASLSLAHAATAPLAGWQRPRGELPLADAGIEMAKDARAWSRRGAPRIAGVSSFGFGGTNVHLVLEEAPVARALRSMRPGKSSEGICRDDRPGMVGLTVRPDAPLPELFLLAAPSRAHLAAYARDLAAHVSSSEVPLVDVAFTLARRRSDTVRAAVVAASATELAAELERVAALAESGAPGISEGPPRPDHEVALLFPGQGAQAPDQCGDLRRRFPRFRAQVEALAACAQPELGRSLVEVMYPSASGGDVARAEAVRALVRTELCQPALAVVELALLDLLGQLGVAGGVLLGHSLGELVALAASGAISTEDTVRLIARRGRLMAELDGEPGVMAALAIDRERAARLVDGVPDAVIANFNHPRQVVVSGTAAAVEQVLARAGSGGVRATRLPVSHAFHSPVVAPVVAPLRAALDEIPLGAPSARLVSCAATGPGLVAEDPTELRARIAQHAAAPVDFEAGVNAAWEAGARVFVQVGAGSALLSMVSATLGAADHEPVVVAAAPADSGRADGGDLLAALAQLHGAGVPVRAGCLFEGRQARLCALPTSRLATRPFWIVRPPDDPAPLPGRPQPDAAPPVDPAEASWLKQLFEQQLDIMRGQLEVLREHGIEAQELPGDAMRPTASGDRVEAVAAAVPAANDAESLDRQVARIVARVSALPPSAVTPAARLATDLGLDSLMMVELTATLQETFQLDDLPDGLFGRDVTVAQLAEHIAGHAGRRAGAPAVVASAPAELARHRLTWVERPLAAPFGAAFGGDAVIAADQGGVAEALAASLSASGRRAHLVAAHDVADLEWPRGFGLFVDVAQLDDAAAAALDPARLRAPLDRALRALAAATTAGVRPAYLAAVRDPVTHAALGGFARALSVEWSDRVAVAVDVGATRAIDVAALVIAELTTTDVCPEVRAGEGTRLVPSLEPAPVDGARPRARTALVTGGGRGLGARIARALAEDGVREILLVGRRPGGADVEALLGLLAEAGARARYASCDVSDQTALERAIASARAEFGPIELVVHAAGQNADGPVERAVADETARVFGTKVGGALALWRACAGQPLTAFLALGSWAGRFGNRHQAVYAAANRAMAGLCAALAAERRDVRVATVDLPPWSGSGMADRLPEAVKRAMRARGVPFLDDERGLPVLLAELAAAPGHAEVVIGAGPRGSGRRDRARIALDPASPWLADHRVKSAPRLPLAAMLDLALAAARRAGVNGPVAVRDLHVVAPIDVEERATLVIDARVVAADGAPQGRVDVELAVEPEDAAAEARMSATCRVEPIAAACEPLAVLAAGVAPVLSVDDFYREHTFHGPRMRGVVRVRAIGASHVSGAVRTADVSWPRSGLDILGIDGALQLAGFFARERLGLAALPVGVAECRVLAPLPAAVELDVIATLERASDTELVGHVDITDAGGQVLVQLRGLTARVVPQAQPIAGAAQPTAGNGAGKNGHNGAGNGNGHGTNVPSELAAIDPTTYTIGSFPEVVELEQRMKMVAAMGVRNPYFHPHDAVTNQRSTIGGQEFIHYSAYNYVGLSGHPEVNLAVERAVARYGTSVSASRVASGEKPLHRDLERAIAGFLGCEDAVVMVGGHATNVSVIGHMFDHRDVILHDSLAHDSIVGGARLAGARRRPFPHNDIDALEQLLAQIRPHARRVLIAVEGVYSMDGDIAPLDRIVEIKRRYGALLLVDEAHSLGVLGRTGRGVGEYFGITRADVDLWMGTLSKSLASCGGYIAGSAQLVQFLKYTTPGFVYSVGISPANAAAALAALDILEREPERVATLQARARFFLDRLRERGVDTGMSRDSAVVPCIVPSSLDCLRLAEALYRRGINVQPILYPAVEENMARLRFFVTAGHSEDDLLDTADAVRDELFAIDPRHLRQVEPPAAPRTEDDVWEQRQ